MKIPIFYQKLESFVIFAIATYGYFSLDTSWWMFVALFFVPDIFMVGYFANSKIGAHIYNIGHSYASPLIMMLLLGLNGVLVDSDTLLGVGLIWIAHIGFDRLLGYGLKTSEGFKHTHLGVIGSKKLKDYLPTKQQATPYLVAFGIVFFLLPLPIRSVSIEYRGWNSIYEGLSLGVPAPHYVENNKYYPAIYALIWQTISVLQEDSEKLIIEYNSEGTGIPQANIFANLVLSGVLAIPLGKFVQQKTATKRTEEA